MGFGSVYSGSKAFDDQFSKALVYEYEQKIDVLSLRPAGVSTPLTMHHKDHGAITPQ